MQQFSRESAAFSVYMINYSYFVFVADGFLNHMVSQFRLEQKRMYEEPDLCGNPMRRQIFPVSIFITVNSRLGHGSAFWSLWTHSELIKRSMWAHSELLIFFSWVIMKMISYRIKGFVTDNVELKSVFLFFVFVFYTDMFVFKSDIIWFMKLSQQTRYVFNFSYFLS